MMSIYSSHRSFPVISDLCSSDKKSNPKCENAEQDDKYNFGCHGSLFSFLAASIFSLSVVNHVRRQNLILHQKSYKVILERSKRGYLPRLPKILSLYEILSYPATTLSEGYQLLIIIQGVSEGFRLYFTTKSATLRGSVLPPISRSALSIGLKLTGVYRFV